MGSDNSGGNGTSGTGSTGGTEGAPDTPGTPTGGEVGHAPSTDTTDTGPSSAATSNVGVDTGTKFGPELEGKTISQALGLDLSNLSTIERAGLAALPGGTTLQGVDALSAHGVDSPSNPGGNVSASATGGVGMGKGGETDPGSNGPGAAGAGGSLSPETIKRVLNGQTLGGGGSAAPDTKQPAATATPTDPFADLNAALSAAHGIGKTQRSRVAVMLKSCVHC